MASFGGDFDLLGMIGAQLIAVKDDNGKETQGIFVPINYNQVKVFRDNKGKDHATFKFNMWPVSKGIEDWWKKQRMIAGVPVTAYNVPTHRIELNLTDEYRQKLAQRAKAVALEQHKEDWTTPEQQDEHTNKDLNNLMYRMSHYDLCSSVWMHEPKSQMGGASAPQPMAQAASVSTTTWRPNFDANGNMSGGSDVPDNSDLPF